MMDRNYYNYKANFVSGFAILQNKNLHDIIFDPMQHSIGNQNCKKA